MTSRASRLLLSATAAALLASAPASAESFGDRGKERLARLFRPVAGKAAESTVRVLMDGKEVALGTVVSADGLILTKGSELQGKGGKPPGEITCKLPDGTLYDAIPLGYHKATDLSLLKVDATDLKPVDFADPSSAVAGNWVAAPGAGADSPAVGVVSNRVRKLVRGEETVIENANRGVMGIRLDDPKDGTPGVLVFLVEPQTPAAKAGLKTNDLICELAGQVVKDRIALTEMLDAYRPGDTVTVRVKRGDEELDLKVRLASRAEKDRGVFQNAMGGSLSGRRTGFPAVIQHDTVVRPIDCGGPLVDLDGKVLGINIARAGRVETWALPADVIASALKELKASKQRVATK